jgi:hypothetical protein
MMTISERVGEICGATHCGPRGITIDRPQIESELRAAIEEMRRECAGKSGAVLSDMGHVDRQTDYHRGQVAAASHILRQIREIKVP